MSPNAVSLPVGNSPKTIRSGGDEAEGAASSVVGGSWLHAGMLTARSKARMQEECDARRGWVMGGSSIEDSSPCTDRGTGERRFQVDCIDADFSVVG